MSAAGRQMKTAKEWADSLEFNSTAEFLAHVDIRDAEWRALVEAAEKLGFRKGLAVAGWSNDEIEAIAKAGGK